MTAITPWISAILGIVGFALVLLSAVLGVTSVSDDVLNAAQLSLVAGAILFLVYVAAGLIKEFSRS